jgi:hypothetical protein
MSTLLRFALACLLPVALLFVGHADATAAVITWRGGVSDAWSQAGNWWPRRVPTSNDHVVFADGTAVGCRIDVPAEAKSVWVGPNVGYTIDQQAELSVGQGLNLFGGLWRANDQALRLSNDLLIEAPAGVQVFDAGTGTVILGDTGFIRIDDAAANPLWHLTLDGRNNFIRSDLVVEGTLAVSADDQNRTVNVVSGSTLTVNDLQIGGSDGYQVTLRSSRRNQAFSLLAESFAVIDHVVLRDVDASQSPGVIFALGESVEDAGGNSGIYFEALLYTATINGGQGSGAYLYGQPVEIVADPPTGEATFVAWQGNTELLEDATSAEQVFTMPSYNVVLSATYSDLPSFEVVVDGGSGSGSYHAGEQVTIAANDPAQWYVFAIPMVSSATSAAA